MESIAWTSTMRMRHTNHLVPVRCGLIPILLKCGREPDAPKGARPVPRGQETREGLALLTFVIVAATKRIIESTIRPAVEQFLAVRGLELNARKTGVVSLDQGFNFLGFTFRRFDGKLLVIPQKEKVQHFLQHLKAILVANKQATQRQLLVLLNPVIRGWVNYYRFCNATRVFNRVDYLLFWKLWRWTRRRHPSKPREWVRQKYFRGGNGVLHWCFGEKGGLQLQTAEATHLLWYRKVAGTASPFNARWRDYWQRRVRYVVATL